jgi:hypothetical protein
MAVGHLDLDRDVTACGIQPNVYPSTATLVLDRGRKASFAEPVGDRPNPPLVSDATSPVARSGGDAIGSEKLTAVGRELEELEALAAASGIDRYFSKQSTLEELAPHPVSSPCAQAQFLIALAHRKEGIGRYKLEIVEGELVKLRRCLRGARIVRG